MIVHSAGILLRYPEATTCGCSMHHNAQFTRSNFTRRVIFGSARYNLYPTYVCMYAVNLWETQSIVYSVSNALNLRFMQMCLRKLRLRVLKLSMVLLVVFDN